MLGLHQLQAGRYWASNFWPVPGLGRGRDSNLELGPGMYIPRLGPARPIYNPMCVFFFCHFEARESMLLTFFLFFF